MPPRGRAVEVALDGDAYRLRYVAVDPDAYHKYYNIVANPMLWFIQHYLWDLGRHPDIGAEEMDAWHNGYLVVNEQFAKAVVDEVRRGADGQRGRGRAGDGSDALVHAARLPPLPRRAGRARRLPARLPAPVHPHPLAAERRLAGAPRAHPERGRRGPARQRRRRLPHARIRAQLPALLRGPARPRRRRGAGTRALRGPRGLGARLPGEHRPGGAARRRRLAPGAHRRAPSPRQAARVPPAARRPARPQQEHHPRLRRASTASSTCTRSTRNASRSSPCSSPPARTSRSTSPTASGWSAWSPT